MTHVRNAICLMAQAVMLFAAAAPAAAQTKNQTATDFYLEFRAAFDKATTIDEVMPYMAKPVRDQVEATPKEQRPMMFDMLKSMATVTNLKVTKETKTDSGATLAVTGLDADKKPTQGTVQIIKEDGAWKVGRESWGSGT